MKKYLLTIIVPFINLDRDLLTLIKVVRIYPIIKPITKIIKEGFQEEEIGEIILQKNKNNLFLYKYWFHINFGSRYLIF